MNTLNKKLILISYDFPPSTGGIARLCHEIVMHLQYVYDEIEVVTIYKEGQSIPYQNSEKIKITYLPSKRVKAEITALKLMRKMTNKENIDVLCGTWHPDASLAILSGMPNVYTLVHGTELLYGLSKFRKYIWLPIYGKWILGKSKKVIANSHYTQKLAQKINPNATTVALPLGVNPDFFKPMDIRKEDDKLKICTVSRVEQFKGHDFILKSLESLTIEYSKKIEWHIAGTGSYLEQLKESASKSVLKDQIYFHGFVPDLKLPEFYNQADLFVLPTRETKESTQVEGFGLVFLEAQACGIPVIGANTGGIPDAIDNGNGGWLIEQDNVEQLHKILINLIDNKDERITQGTNARDRVLEKANWKVYVEKLFSEMNI